MVVCLKETTVGRYSQSRKYYNTVRFQDKCNKIVKNNEKFVLQMSNLKTHYHFKFDFQKMDQHTRGKWLIHGTKHRKDNQLQSLEPTYTIS